MAVNPTPGLCPAGCSRPKRVEHLMCGRCWSSLPADLQHAVLRTWREYRRLVGVDLRKRDMAAVRRARLAYRDASDAAIAHVR